MMDGLAIRRYAGHFIVWSPAITFALVAIGVFALDIIGVIHFPAGFFGVSGFYIGSAFITLSVLMFGRGAFAAIYLGLFLAAYATGRVSALTPILNFCNIVGALAPFLIFKLIGRTGVQSYADAGWYIISAGVLQTLLSGGWFFGILWIANMLPTEAFPPAIIGWFIGGLAVQIVIGLPAARAITRLFADRSDA